MSSNNVVVTQRKYKHVRTKSFGIRKLDLTIGDNLTGLLHEICVNTATTRFDCKL